MNNDHPLNVLSPPLVGRIWRGRTAMCDADAYLAYSLEQGVQKIARKPTCLGVQHFRRLTGDIAEFTTISYWASVEAMSVMQPDQADPLRVWPLAEDQRFLLELPEFVEVAELHASTWR